MPVNAAALEGVEPPFYLLDLPRLEAKYRRLRDAFAARFPRAVVAVSYKTNHLGAMLERLHGLGAWAEVVSGPEYEYALHLGVAPARIVYNGPGKRPGELARALSQGAVVNLDSVQEATFAAEWALGAEGHARGVGVRLNLALPDAEPGRRSRFGVEPGQLREVAEILAGAGLGVEGLHTHLTSQRRRLDYYREVAGVLADGVDAVGREGLAYLDVGGGFAYLPPEVELEGVVFPSFEEYAETLDGVLRARVRDLDDLAVYVEPGIALSGDCLTYYAPVLATKELGGRSLAVVDGSVHTVKPTRHPVHLPTRVLDPRWRLKRAPVRAYDVVGYTCLEDDVIAHAQELPALEAGDVLAIGNVGAYTFVFKPPFIRPMPPFYAWDGAAVRLVRASQTVAEAFGCHGR